MRRSLGAIALTFMVCATVAAQTPQPFPSPSKPAQTPAPVRPTEPAAPPARQPAPAPAPPQAAPTQVPPAQAAPAAPPSVQPAQPRSTPAPAPTAQSLGFPIYPAAQYLSTHDAGRGQKYVLFGTTAPFADLVVYYRTQLKDDGELVFREPPTHVFEVGRFREETMVFPPGVTVKDFTWGGSMGYPNPKLNGQPARFPTVIMFATAAPAPPAAR